MKLIIKTLKIFLFSFGLLVILLVSIYGYQDIPLADLKIKYAPKPSSFITVEGMEVHFRDEGDPTDSIPIVLIHGTGSSLHTFDEWAIGLNSEYRVIRMDLPAYGLTGSFPHRDYSIDKYVEFIQHFLETLGVEECIIGGNSLGGNIAWKFTVEHPKIVDKLILIDAGGYPSMAKSIPIAFKIARIPIIKNIFTFITPRFVAKESIENVFADKTKVSEALVDRHFELTLREGNRQAFIDRFDAKIDTSDYQKIKLITKKTLVLWGEQDKLIPLDNAFLFHKDLQNDTLVIIKNAGHVPMEESPDQSLEAVISFLKNH